MSKKRDKFIKGRRNKGQSRADRWRKKDKELESTVLELVVETPQEPVTLKKILTNADRLAEKKQKLAEIEKKQTASTAKVLELAEKLARETKKLQNFNEQRQRLVQAMAEFDRQE